MEAKGRKMLALGVVAMMCAVAIIGIGYAAFAGNASTYTTGNSATAGYMTITPGSGAEADWQGISLSTDVEIFDTYSYYSSGAKVAYWFNSAGTPATISEANYVVRDVASRTYTIQNESGDSLSAINFAAKASTTAGNSDFKYFVKVASGANAAYIEVSTSGANASINLTSAIGDHTSGDITVSICIAYTPDVYVPADKIGPAIAPSNEHPANAKQSTSGPVDMSSVDFAFTVTGANPQI